MEVLITPERPDSADARTVIAELDAELTLLYPSESRHGYDVARLIAEDVAFFLIRRDGAAAGCGGIQLFGTEYGELKRMYVRPAFRGQGLAKAILSHLAGFARDRGVRLLRLETGIHQLAAIALYERAGFRSIAAFGEYEDDPLSRFYEMPIP